MRVSYAGAANTRPVKSPARPVQSPFQKPAFPAGQPEFGRTGGIKELLEWLEVKHLYVTDKGARLEEVKSEVLKNKIQDVYFKTYDGLKLHAWYVPAEPGKPTAVYAHGNSGNLARHYRLSIMENFVKRGYGFLAFDYRGFGNSEGSPTEQGLYRDMRSASLYLAKHQNVPVSRQIAMGDSLGGGVVTQVASEYPYRAVILLSTFTSIPDVVAKLKTTKYGIPNFVPAERIFNQVFDSVHKIQNVRSPLLIVHGDRDETTPVEMGRKLFEEATGTPLKRYIEVQGGEHTNLFDLEPDRIMNTIQELLELSEAQQTEDAPVPFEVRLREVGQMLTDNLRKIQDAGKQIRLPGWRQAESKVQSATGSTAPASELSDSLSQTV